MTSKSETDSRSPLAWVLIPAVVMSLGWGLRGYIGGGPFGAMIPGALVTLIICQYLGYGALASAAVVAFGAFGVGFGGLMTYGQTLGLLRADDTFAWGLTGTTLKGGVWGLLGGAVIGLGFAAPHIPRRHVLLAFAVMLAGVAIGIHFINAPKLIYFSDPVNKPRDESWAGLLLGALALLGYTRLAVPGSAWIPARFAAYGLIGGAIGFGPGSLFIAVQPRIDKAWSWLPFWKFMEFSFGFVFGAALGLCAYHLRERLKPLASNAEREQQPHTASAWSASGLLSLLGGVLVVYGVFRELHLFVDDVIPQLREVPVTDWRHTIIDTLLGFTGLGCVLMVLSTRWDTVAWQSAISVTIVAAAIDWQRDLLDRGGINMPEQGRTLYVLGMAAVSILFVHWWQWRERPRLMTLFLFATCVLMGIGYQMGLGWSDIWWGNPEAEVAAGGRGAYLLQKFRSELIVHAIFTTLFVISIVAGIHERRRKPGPAS
ncbi:MAG: hypothetical protein U0992_03340 [Planctomycetaceae bacterium]